MATDAFGEPTFGVAKDEGDMRMGNRLKKAVMTLVGPALSFAMACAPPVFAQQVSVDGVWQSEDGEGLVEVAPCAVADDQRCGKIVWIKAPLGPDGRPVVDAKNPDDALKKRPICGLEILSGFKPTADGGYDRGSIYDPEEGKRYGGAMRLVGDKLKVTGSVDVPILGQLSDSESWTRVIPPFARCTIVTQK